MSAEELRRFIFGPTVVIYVRETPEHVWTEACRWMGESARICPHINEEIVFTNRPAGVAGIARVRQVRHIVDGDYGRLQFINVYTDWL